MLLNRILLRDRFSIKDSFCNRPFIIFQMRFSGTISSQAAKSNCEVSSLLLGQSLGRYKADRTHRKSLGKHETKEFPNHVSSY